MRLVSGEFCDILSLCQVSFVSGEICVWCLVRFVLREISVGELRVW